MEEWLLFQEPGYSLQFNYPRSASDGEVVERVETRQDGMLRVHILTPRSREVYFEVSRYVQLSAESEYQRHKAHLPKQFDSFEITGLEEALCASLPARAYTFSWPQGKRTVLLIEREDAMYRLLYNPIPVVNRAILSNVEWLNLP